MYNAFVPLALGEAPGDPELGGWRPLPKCLFHKQTSLGILSAVITLDQAVAMVGFAVQYVNLRRAIKALAIDLALSPHYFVKGGVQFS